MGGVVSNNMVSLSVGYVFGKCHAPCTLKTFYVDLKKKGRHIAKDYNFFVPPQLCILFQWQ
jgi:hypothetical protein